MRDLWFCFSEGFGHTVVCIFLFKLCRYLLYSLNIIVTCITIQKKIQFPKSIKYFSFWYCIIKMKIKQINIFEKKNFFEKHNSTILKRFTLRECVHLLKQFKCGKIVKINFCTSINFCSQIIGYMNKKYI